MADQILQNEQNSLNPSCRDNPLSFSSSFSCPCCSFLSYNDLFLPVTATTGGEREEIDAPIKKNGEEEEEDMMSPLDALDQIRIASPPTEEEEDNKGEKRRKRVLLVDTHGHPHLNRERQSHYINPDKDENDDNNNNSNTIRLSCAVSESDWTQTLQYASTSKSILPALGIHPWYLSSLSPTYLHDLEILLQQHPNAIVGEIGLCKVAKFIRTYEEGKTAALELQRRVFREQLELAVRLKRVVSVHCVQQHGVLMSLLKEMREEAKIRIAKERKLEQKGDGREEEGGGDDNSKWCLADAFPPKIGMHSFTGTAHHVKELLAFEESLYDTFSDRRGKKKAKKKKKKKKQKEDDDGNQHDDAVEKDENTIQNPALKRKPIFYFGFSHSINVVMCSSSKSRKQGIEAIRAVPTNRLLAESDVHSHEDVPAATAGSVSYIAKAIGWDLMDTAELTALNGFEFLGVGDGGNDDVLQQQQQKLGMSS
eukprot:CAMPEP_0185727878 /NCGR_PEP_ID=MMETSP1171-20130828/3436_1 /TAXON_ID=374046 /ORGANISM="Helicotheca tamensis, Strain CCMP826" /LENGTH=480 /DNA_ID=CAMNT_0028396523 /DNA_START=585 /DNA_END=2027 /DNA_ORIENTATION=-